MKHKGFSLIECIIVIAVMSIVIGSLVFGFGYLDSANANKCAFAIDSAITTTKAETMSKTEPVNLYLYQFDGTCCIKYSNAADFVADGSNAEVVGAARVTVSYDDGTGKKELTSTPQIISFSRKDGSFSSGPNVIYIDGTDSYEIRLIKNTGKHIIKSV